MWGEQAHHTGVGVGGEDTPCGGEGVRARGWGEGTPHQGRGRGG